MSERILPEEAVLAGGQRTKKMVGIDLMQTAADQMEVSHAKVTCSFAYEHGISIYEAASRRNLPLHYMNTLERVAQERGLNTV